MIKESTEENLVRYTQEELDALVDDTDWERVDAMTDEEIYRITGEPPITEEEPSGLEVVMIIDGVEVKPGFLKPKIVRWFAEHTDDYPSKINEVLQNYINKQSQQLRAAD